MNYWLMKSEPDVFGIDDLVRLRQAPWDGIRNYQVRNMLRDQFQIGDLAFFYHSSCKVPAIVGVMKIISLAYPDTHALNPTHPYFDPKCTPEKLPWLGIDVELVEKFNNPITLNTLRQHQDVLADLILLRKGNRLSITPVTEKDWQYILTLTTNA